MLSILVRIGKAAGLAALAGAAFASALPASADEYCDSLAAQLAALPREGAAPRQNPGRSGALLQELNRAQWEARRFNCTVRFFGPPPHPYCRQINAQIAQLRAQLRSAGGGFGGFGGGGSVSGDWRRGEGGGWQPAPAQAFASRAERQRILQAMAAYNCPMPQTQLAGGALRTLCVRSCDGYYFPISFSTTRARLKIDEAVCKGMYPEGEASLFIHNSGGQESASAVSLKGEPYSAQSYAFAYTKQFSPACRALLTTGLASLGERFKAAVAEKFAAEGRDPKSGRVPRDPLVRTIAVPPVAAARPSSDDPETLANRDGRFAVEPARPVAMVDLDEKKPVRVVGGFFYNLPTPEESAAMMKLRQPGRPLVTDRQPVAADMLPVPLGALTGGEETEVGHP